MKINWKVRFKNPVFWFQMMLAVGAPVLAYYGLTGQDLTSWGSVFRLVKDALSNPYVLVTALVAAYLALNDPTTAGHSDSDQAMDYQKPRKE